MFSMENLHNELHIYVQLLSYCCYDFTTGWEIFICLILNRKNSMTKNDRNNLLAEKESFELDNFTYEIES